MSRRRERLNTGRTNTARSVPHSPITRTPANGDAPNAAGARSARSGNHSARTQSTARTTGSRRSVRRSESARKLSATGGAIVSGRSARSSARLPEANMSRCVCGTLDCQLEQRAHSPLPPCWSASLDRCVMQSKTVAFHANPPRQRTRAAPRSPAPAHNAQVPVADARRPQAGARG